MESNEPQMQILERQNPWQRRSIYCYILSYFILGSNFKCVHILISSFLVDPTPPEVITPPHFRSARDGSKAASQWDRSVLHLAWEFRDRESSVVKHTVYIRSKETGRLVIDPLVLGAETGVWISSICYSCGMFQTIQNDLKPLRWYGASWC